MSQVILRSGIKAVVGLGKTGLSCVRYLKHQGYSVAVHDTRQDPPGLTSLQQEFPDVEVYLGALDAQRLMQAEEVVVSPGLSIQEPALTAVSAAGIPLIGDIELFVRAAQAPVVAITGSNAKSTVTTLVGEMAAHAGKRVAVGGNLGLPALDLLGQADTELYVLELSSFQLETTHSLKASVATILNLSEDHLDRYGSMPAYHKAKQRIYRQCQAAVFNRDDTLTQPLLPASVAVSSFGLGQPDLGQWGVRTEQGIRYLALGMDCLMPVKDLPLMGDHNVANALAALALGRQAGLPIPAMLEAIKAFRGLEHRCQHVRELDGVVYYDDSKGTNVGATVAAIEGLGSTITGKVIVILGGVGKGQDFQPLHDPLKSYARAAVLMGVDAPAIAASLPQELTRLHADSMVSAVQIAKSMSVAGDVVLLSPACASFDMFVDYHDRGHQFVRAVGALT
ncbi:MAG: UDP-N-acetylmuramoyl-L-alanine--D-glutamate ligase [Pseudomonadales bacterium]|nr:UDP-N-acetylmuramoyl-L-alanine--D-glutamate ligase [Pseudomonadales bacterium]